ncbi:hypothetical protein N7476_005120 [Penicillium atrosanguineum]|uniref:Uncharacterized protein n=1 Tax=Penicillium atrosanguineum TaxID=1132637 RepID=A0A9W9U5U6_9EURO|nr:hypothetical protein N7476_005120 [Penicillium atrosanguineum]
MQNKLASNLEAMEYAIDQAAIRLAEENPLPMRKRLVRFVCCQFFSSNPIVALQYEDPRWTLIKKLNEHILPPSRSTPDFHELQSRSPIELNLALLFDCALETRAQLKTVRDFQCDFVRFMPGELHDQDVMRMFWARGARAY